MSALYHKELPSYIYMDLSKAFNTLDHSILIDKLSHYGIKCNALQWFSSYLSNHTMHVEIDNAKSSVRHLTTGVPQGSILGPLLFLIYMNDISNSPANNFTFPERSQNVPPNHKKCSHNIETESSPDVHERSPITLPHGFWITLREHSQKVIVKP